MDKHDIPQFSLWLTALVEYFPASKVNLEVIAEGYFEDLRCYSLATVEATFVQARRRCKFFPTVAELLEIVEALRKHDFCHTCRDLHGVHFGMAHRVSHQEDGPYCETCETALPVPVSYTYQPALPPPAQARRTPLSLPPVRPMTPEDRERIAQLVAREHADVAARQRQKELDAANRKEFLRAQARMLLAEAEQITPEESAE